MAARIGLFMVSMACLTTCVGLIWVQWHIRHELNSLRKQVDSVQNGDKSASDILNIKAQMEKVKSKITTLETGAGGLSGKILNLTKELKQVKDMQNSKADEISPAALADLPKKMKVLTDSITEIADLKSDLKNVEATQNAKNAEVDKRLQALEADHEAAVGPGGGSMDKQFGEMLKEELDNQNRSMTGGLLSVGQELAQQSSKLSALEQLVSDMNTPAVDQDSINAMVSKAVQQQVANISTNQADETTPPAEMVENTEFLAFKEDMLQNILEINTTVFVLDSEFDDLAKRLDLIEASVVNITAKVAQSQTKPDGNSPPQPMPQKTQTPLGEKITVSHPTTTTTPEKPPQAPKVKETDMTNTGGIDTKEKLHAAFLQQAKDKDGEVNADAANQIVGDKVDAHALELYDSDSNGMYSEDELAQALGFVTTIPPRR